MSVVSSCESVSVWLSGASVCMRSSRESTGPESVSLWFTEDSVVGAWSASSSSVSRLLPLLDRHSLEDHDASMLVL